MKSFSPITLVLPSLLTLAAAPAFAQEAAKSATFWIDHDVLTYTNETTKPDQGDETESTGLVTTPNDVTIGIFWDQYGLYVTPGAAGGLVKGSFYPSKELELGLSLGLAHTESESVTGIPAVKTTTESKSTSYGIWGTYYLPVSANTTAEFTADILLGNREATAKPSNGAETKLADENSTQITLLAQYAWEVAKHFAYIPGISYTHRTEKDDQANTDDKTSIIALNIAHFRYIF